MDDERYNSPHTSMIQFEVLGELLQFAQDPNSKHLGTTVWDASMVFVKFLEKNCRKGQFSPSKLSGKRVIELGAGCGLAGFGMALLGCDVVATDQTEVLPLLMRNAERNTLRIKQANAENPYSASFGSIQVAELDWGNQEHIAAVGPPFDYIIGTDIVYVERLLEPLLKTILSLAGPRTTVLLGYELRSTIVDEKMNELWRTHFDVKRIPKIKMDSKYQHANIDLFTMRLRNEKVSSSAFVKPMEHVPLQECSEIQNDSKEYSRNSKGRAKGVSSEPISQISLADKQLAFVHSKAAECTSKYSLVCTERRLAERNEVGTGDQPQILCKKNVGCSSNDYGALSEEDLTETCKYSNDDQQLDGTEEANLKFFKGDLISDLEGCDHWQIRRYGSLAARLLQNVQIP